MKVKIGTKLLSPKGDVWIVSRFDHHNQDRVVVRTHDGHRFYAHKALLHHHAKKLRIWHQIAMLIHRIFRWFS